MKVTTCSALACIALLGAGAAAQTSELFMFSYQTQKAYVVQNGNLNRSWTQQTSNEFVGAVTPTEIRTIGANGGVGYEYDLNGNLNGPSFNNPGIGSIYDGTTDGVNYNYANTYGSGNVYRCDRDWQNPVLIFNAGLNNLGIAYDPNTDTLWTAGNGGAACTNFDLNGNVITSFVPGNGVYGVAFDPADNTLWMSGDSGSALYQYATNGTLLQTIDKVGLWGANGTLGLEFAVGSVPAPGSASLLGLGALVAARRRRA